MSEFHRAPQIVPPDNNDAPSVTAWLTSADQTFLLDQQSIDVDTVGVGEFAPITVDAERPYQPIEGFGFSLTGGSAMLISRLPDAKRQALLRELFTADGDGIGISFLRLSIGASDLSEYSYSYDDLPDGQTDFELAQFDLMAGDREVVPLLRQILQINSDIKIIATPWSAPRWMKTNGAFVGGELKPDCRDVYARYFVRYLRSMREHGIAIHAVTPQNEPQNFKNDPSMVMSAEQQADFIKHYLGPALAEAGFDAVDVLCWDHNCDVTEYALAIFADPEASARVSGSAWHLYGGDISALSEIHHAHPDKKLYFTEQWVGSDGQFGGDLIWHVNHVLIGALRNWSRVVLEWNLAADPFCCPHTAGGEARCVGALTIDSEQVTRNVAYYIIAHAAKWLRPGSVRIHSSDDTLPNVAFLTPNGQMVLIALNPDPTAKTVGIEFQGQSVAAVLPGATVATYVWGSELTTSASA